MQLFRIFGAVPLISIGEALLTPFGWIFKVCYMIAPWFAVAMFLYALFFKAILFPLDVKRQRSQAKMMRLQPRINALQKKYANDRQKLSEEMNKLQTEEGYNPFGGCLPSLLPLPIFFCIYWVIIKPLTYLCSVPSTVINNAMELLGLTSKSRYYELTVYRAVFNSDAALAGSEIMGYADKIEKLDMSLFGIDLTLGVRDAGAPWYYWLFPIVMVLLSVASSWVMGAISKKNNEGMAGANAASNPLMVIGMPLLTGVITYYFPSGVLLYWMFNSLLMLASNLILNKFWPMKKLSAEYDAEIEALRAAGKPVTKSSKFRQKLAAAQAKNEQDVQQYQEMKDLSNSRKKELERRMIAKARERELESAQQEAEHRTDEAARAKYREMAAKNAKKNRNNENGGSLQ